MAAEILSISLTTLDALIAEGIIPPAKPLGSSRRLYWLPDEFYGHLRRMLGSGEAVDSSAKAPPTSPESPRPPQKMSVPKRARAAPEQAKRSDLRARQAKRIESLNG
jgi:hypothetical protein